jgi:hypothetical protein
MEKSPVSPPIIYCVLGWDSQKIVRHTKNLYKLEAIVQTFRRGVEGLVHLVVVAALLISITSQVVFDISVVKLFSDLDTGNLIMIWW